MRPIPRLTGLSCLATLLLLPCAPAARAQPAPPDPDWPCQQRLVPHLQAGSYWATGTVPTGDFSWRDDPKLTALITGVVDRDTNDAAATTSLRAYIRHLAPGMRAASATRLFGFLVDETNDQRDQVIDRIRQLARRQRNLDTTIARVSNEADATHDDAQRADLAGQRDFNIQTFQEAQHTIRYACEVPPQFERRLGLFAAALH